MSKTCRNTDRFSIPTSGTLDVVYTVNIVNLNNYAIGIRLVIFKPKVYLKQLDMVK